MPVDFILDRVGKSCDFLCHHRMHPQWMITRLDIEPHAGKFGINIFLKHFFQIFRALVRSDKPGCDIGSADVHAVNPEFHDILFLLRQLRHVVFI